MEEIFKFVEKHWLLTIVIILGMLAPGMIFIFLWDAKMFWEEDILKVLLLSSGIMCTIYIYNFLLLYLGYLIKPIEESIKNMGMERIIIPIMCSCIELAMVIFVKIYLVSFITVTKEKAILIIFIVSALFIALQRIFLIHEYKTDKRELEKILGRELTEKEYDHIIENSDRIINELSKKEK